MKLTERFKNIATDVPASVNQNKFYSEKEIMEENKPTIVRKVISNETSKTVRSTLETVVAYGTGRNAYIEGYRVGGKTGTAQKVKNGVYMSGNYIVSFIGFIPADNPQAIVYVASYVTRNGYGVFGRGEWGCVSVLNKG